MVDDRLSRTILSYLVRKHAYSLVVIEQQEGKRLLLNFRSLDTIDDLLETCLENGISITPGKLSDAASKVLCAYAYPQSGRCRMHGRFSNEEFYVGEIMRLNIRPNGVLEMIKIDEQRWWLTSAMALDMPPAFFVPKGSFGAGSSIEISGATYEIESVDFVVATDETHELDRIIFPSFYATPTPPGVNLEELLVLPFYEEFKKNPLEIAFSRWLGIAQSAYEKGMDFKTIWHVACAMANCYNRVYTWE